MKSKCRGLKIRTTTTCYGVTQNNAVKSFVCKLPQSFQNRPARFRFYTCLHIFYASAGKGGRGLFVTTSKFTRQAVNYAKKQHIILMDGEKLAYYMIEHNFGVSTRKKFEIKAIDSDLFEDYQDV